MAYDIFDKKYTMKEISEMPYRILLEKIEHEQELNKYFEQQAKMKNKQ